jgi:hypothetical protein
MGSKVCGVFEFAQGRTARSVRAEAAALLPGGTTTIAAAARIPEAPIDSS